MSKKKLRQDEHALGHLHVTVVALTMGGLDLTRETEMTKAALLYADKVTIASPSASLLAALASLTIGDERQRMRTLSQLAGALPGGEAIPPAVDYLLSRKHYSRQELLMLGQLRGSALELQRVVETQLDEAGAGELDSAIESGVVDIDLLGVDEVASEEDLNLVLERVVSLIETAVASSSTSHPLFDGAASDLLRAMMEEGTVTDVAFSPATEIGLASSFITGLEAFPKASMDVVLDVRERLRDPLVRFRGAVDAMSRDAREMPFGPAFDPEVRRLYRIRVEPALLEIRELMDDMGVRPTLARAASTGIPSGAIAFLVGAGLGAPDWVKLGSLGGAAVGAAAKEYLKRRDLVDRARSNEIFFLYAADSALARS